MKIFKTIGTGVASLGLVVGMGGVAGATSGVIDHTGPDSWNKIEASTECRVNLDNNTNAEVNNFNGQGAFTGSASVSNNTTGGSAHTGDAVNSNSTGVKAHVDNSSSSKAALGAGAGSTTSDSAKISTTGPDSWNKVEMNKSSKLNVNNNTNLQVSNGNVQLSASGSASVYKNTTGGSAITGDARNTNNTVVDVKVAN